jgi:hypothetical protein
VAAGTGGSEGLAATIPVVLWQRFDGCVPLAPRTGLVKRMNGPEAFFIERLQVIEAFLVDPGHVCLRLVIDPEMRRMPLNYLGKREDDPSFPHLVLSFFEPFDGPHSWFARLLAMLEREIDAERETLAELGVDVSRPVPAAEHRSRTWELFLAQAERIAEGLPDHVGSLTFVLEPEEVRDPANWERGIRYLADRTASRWLKFIILEPRLDPLLADLREHPKVATELFWLSPAEIERRADAVIAASGGL